MSINLKQNPDGSLGLEGKDLDTGAFLVDNTGWTASSAGTVLMYIAPRAMVVQAITARVETAGTDVGAVTATVYKAPSGTAISAGTALHSGTINLKGTAATNQSLTLSTTAGALNLNKGDAVGFVLTGVMTAAVGSVSIALTPA